MGHIIILLKGPGTECVTLTTTQVRYGKGPTAKSKIMVFWMMALFEKTLQSFLACGRN